MSIITREAKQPWNTADAATCSCEDVII